MSHANDGAGVKLDALGDSEILICDTCHAPRQVSSDFVRHYRAYNKDAEYTCRECLLKSGRVPITLGEFMQQQGCDHESVAVLAEMFDAYVAAMLGGKIIFFIADQPVTFTKLPNGFFHAAPSP